MKGKGQRHVEVFAGHMNKIDVSEIGYNYFRVKATLNVRRRECFRFIILFIIPLLVK